MTSRSSSSLSDRDSAREVPSLEPPRLSYRLLLLEPARYQAVLELLRSAQWAALRDLMEAERLQQLEALGSSDDRDQMLRHQAVARWLGFFIDDNGLREELLTAYRQSSVPNDNEGSHYMERDSGAYDAEV